MTFAASLFKLSLRIDKNLRYYDTGVKIQYIEMLFVGQNKHYEFVTVNIEKTISKI